MIDRPSIWRRALGHKGDVLVAVGALVAGILLWGWIGAIGIIVLIAIICGVIVEILRRRKWQADADHVQLETLVEVYAALQPALDLPPMRSWAVRPDFVKHLVRLVEKSHPDLVLEAGSGASTIATAYCLRNDRHGRVVSLEQQEQQAELVTQEILRHGLQDFAEVRYAALKTIELGGHTWQWYDTAKLQDLTGIDMVIVDGPSGDVQSKVRYPMLPAVYSRLSDRAIVLLDDARRPDEKAIVRSWMTEFPVFDVEQIATERGMAVMRRKDTGR